MDSAGGQAGQVALGSPLATAAALDADLVDQRLEIARQMISPNARKRRILDGQLPPARR
jgi:hypothetical protein